MLKALLFFVTLLCTTSIFAQTQILQTPSGFIKGQKEGNSYVYKGVPYAQAPVGKLRFMPPQPVKPWSDTLSCLDFGSMASQYSDAEHKAKGSEDCLSMNIYTPVGDSMLNSTSPVLVWIHGGAMTEGTGRYQNAHAFSDRDHIITITLNYRLGVFGFLYLGDVNPALNMSGNNGLLDCIEALKWIRKNIAAFGGDPSRITVVGESAGAKLTSALDVSPLAKGYFKQLILESGSVQCIRDTNTAKFIRKRILAELHLRKPADLLDLSAKELLEAQSKVCNGVQGTNYFGPVNDGIVLKGDPYQYIMAHSDKAIRFLIGTNKEESKQFMRLDKQLYHPDKTVLKAWFGTNYAFVLSEFKRVSKAVGPDSAAVSVLTQYMYQMHSYRMADALSKAGNPVWLYRFDFKKDSTGATHGKELPFVWSSPDKVSADPTIANLTSEMHQAWVNFVRGKKPGIIDHSDWPMYTSYSRKAMVFNVVSGPVVFNSFNDKGYPSAGFILRQ